MIGSEDRPDGDVNILIFDEKTAAHDAFFAHAAFLHDAPARGIADVMLGFDTVKVRGIKALNENAAQSFGHKTAVPVLARQAVADLGGIAFKTYPDEADRADDRAGFFKLKTPAGRLSVPVCLKWNSVAAVRSLKPRGLYCAVCA